VPIVIAGIWAYATSFTGVFVLDDVRAIVSNETIRTLWPPTGPLAPPTGSTVAGRPVANLTFALNYALAADEVRDAFTPPRQDAGTSSGAFPRNVWGYHLGNVLVHLAAGLTLFGVIRRTLTTPRLAPQFGLSASYVACAVALVWVVHPPTTESVTYLVQRVESRMWVFYLLTVYCAIRAEDDPPRRRAWMAAAVGSCALGMATKETMVSAPLAVAVWYYLFTDGLHTRWRRVAALAASWLVLAGLVAGEGRGPSVDVAGGTMWRSRTRRPTPTRTDEEAAHASPMRPTRPPTRSRRKGIAVEGTCVVEGGGRRTSARLRLGRPDEVISGVLSGHYGDGSRSPNAARRPPAITSFD
jgi:hypothetical protein